MKLSRRLETIARMVPETAEHECVADIGTDHGFVPIWLLTHGRAARALAMDVRTGPLERAREHILQYGLGDRIETRLSDGLAKLQPGEAHTVVIAGMGGELMLRILRDGDHVRDSVKYWVLSPQSELSLFRHGLEKLGLVICAEQMIEEDGKYYTVMLAEKGSMHYDREYQYRYGDCLIRDRSAVLREFLRREQQQYFQIADRLKQQSGDGARRRLEEMERELEEIGAALAEIGTTGNE